MSEVQQNKKLTADIETLRLANYDFCFSLYTELAKTNTENMFYSPFSIHVIMFMASFGADSKTFDEMVATIHVNKSNHSLEAYQKLLENLTSKTDDVLKLATGMFVDTAFKINQLFIDNSLKYLNSHMEKLNFLSDPESQRQYLNNWVLNNTNHKIKDLFPEGSIDETTALVLANAVHFQGKWNKKFSFTQKEPFYLDSDNKVTVQMMNLKHDLNYYHDDELKYSVLQLPYESGTFNMFVLLPDAKDGLTNLEANLSKIKLNEISEKMKKFYIIVKLPRFKLEQSFELKETLSNLGCPTIFTRDANFSNITDDCELYVSNVLHKAYVNVDEKGTEAAAATGIIYPKQQSAIYIEPRYQIKFFADHPFIFYITSRNKDIIFFGRVKNLTGEK